MSVGLIALSRIPEVPRQKNRGQVRRDRQPVVFKLEPPVHLLSVRRGVKGHLVTVPHRHQGIQV